MAGRDWTEIDAGIERLISEHQLTPGHRKTRCRSLKRFDEFCRERGWKGRGAPLAAYLALVGVVASRGYLLDSEAPKSGAAKPWSPGHLRGFISAIRKEHEAAGLIAAIDLPENRAEWEATLRGYGRQPELVDRQVKHTVPLMRDEVRAMLEADPEWSLHERALAACAFLVIDHGLGWDNLLGVAPSSIATSASSVTVPLDSGGLVLLHVHKQQHEQEGAESLVDLVCPA